MPLTTYTAGEVLTAASLNANLSFAASSPASGLTLIASASYSSATSFTITNCFSATYRNYYLVFDSSGNNAMCTAQLAVSGVASTTGYGYQLFEASSTASSVSRSSNQSSMNLAPLSIGGQMDVMIYRPALAQRTGFIIRNIYGASFSSANPAFYDIRGIHDVATAYDSITVTGAASGLTGKYFIYGLAE